MRCTTPAWRKMGVKKRKLWFGAEGGKPPKPQMSDRVPVQGGSERVGREEEGARTGRLGCCHGRRVRVGEADPVDIGDAFDELWKCPVSLRLKELRRRGLAFMQPAKRAPWLMRTLPEGPAPQRMVRLRVLSYS
mgnify:FL=1